MRKRPGMTLLVIAALIVGIGVNSAVFTVVNAVLIRPWPLPSPDRLVLIMMKTQKAADMPVSYPEYLDWKSQCHSFQDLAILRFLSANLTGASHPEHLNGLQVSSSFFKVLGVPPARGRDFTEEDDRPGANRVVIISQGLWEQTFGSDASILGKAIVLNDQPYTVIGVAATNHFPYMQFDLWVPNGLFSDQVMLNRLNRYYGVIARLNRGVTREQADREMAVISDRLAQQYPQSDKDMQAYVLGITSMFAGMNRGLIYIMALSSVILLLACVNVVIVFLANAVERRKELSVRLALGAGRGVLLRQFFVQGLILAGIGGAAGLAVARIGLFILLKYFPYAIGRLEETTIDSTVIFFTLATTLGVSLMACIAPTLFAASLNVNSELKGERSNWPILSRYRRAGQSALIVVEVSLAFVLTLVSGLLIKSLYNIEQLDLGFNPERVLSFQVSLPPARYNGPARITAFYEAAVHDLRAVPGVRMASAVSALPLSRNYHFINLEVEGQPIPVGTQHPFVDSSSVMPGYFETIHSHIILGRDFNESDRSNSVPVAIVDEVLATRMWPGQNPVGKRIRLADEGDNGPPWREVIGVVRQIKHYGPEQEVPRLQVYVPLLQQPVPTMTFVIDFQSDQGSVVSSAQKVIAGLDKDLPLDLIHTMEDWFSSYTGRRRLSVLLLGSFAVIGVLLGLIGIYGIVANSIVRMRREIAIRMALGASARSAIILVTRLGLIGTAAGILIGAALTLACTRVLAAYLFGVASYDPGTYLLSAFAVFVLAMIASMVPAKSLLRFKPQEILKEQ